MSSSDMQVTHLPDTFDGTVLYDLTRCQFVGEDRSDVSDARRTEMWARFMEENVDEFNAELVRLGATLPPVPMDESK